MSRNTARASHLFLASFIRCPATNSIETLAVIELLPGSRSIGCWVRARLISFKPEPFPGLHIVNNFVNKTCTTSTGWPQGQKAFEATETSKSHPKTARPRLESQEVTDPLKI